MKILVRLASLLAILLAAPAAADCTLSAVPMTFGRYDPGAAAPLDAMTTVTVSCAGSSTARLSVAGGNPGDRVLSTPSGDLHYALYWDAARTQLAGEAAYALPVSGNASIPLFARIFPGQPVPPGEYDVALTLRLDP